MGHVKQAWDRFKGESIEQRLIILATASIFLTAPVALLVLLSISIYILVKRDIRTQLLKSDGLIYLALFTLFAGLSAIFSANWLGLGVTVFIMIPILILALFVRKFATPAFIPRLMYLIVSLSIPVAVYGLIQGAYNTFLGNEMAPAAYLPNAIWKYMIYAPGGRIYSVFHNSNLYAYMLMLFMLIGFALLLTNSQRRVRIVSFISLVLNGIALYLTDCRSVWPALAVSLIIMTFIMKRTRIAIILSVLLIAAAAIVLLNPNSLVPRYQDMQRDLNLRLSIFNVAVDAIKAKPVLGWGLLSFRDYAIEHFKMNYTHAHNILLNTLMDFGLVGISLFSLYFINLFRNTRKALAAATPYRREIAIGIACLIAALLHGVTDIPMFNIQTGMLTMMILAFIPACVKSTEQGK